MDLEKVIKNAVQNPVCTLLNKHYYCVTRKHPLQFTCYHCGNVLDLPPDVVVHIGHAHYNEFKYNVGALGTKRKDED